MTAPQVLGVVGSITILVTLFEMLRRHRLREKYAVVWFVLALGALVVGIFPDALASASSFIGVAIPSNLLFFVAALVLLGLSLQHSYELGRSEERIRTLAEEIALLRLERDSPDVADPGASDRHHP